MVARVWLWASCGEMFLIGSSGVTSSSLLHLSFQIKKEHSDIIIRKRWVAPFRVCPLFARIFRRGRAIMVVMSVITGHALQLKRMCCIWSIFLSLCTYPFLASSFRIYVRRALISIGNF